MLWGLTWVQWGSRNQTPPFKLAFASFFLSKPHRPQALGGVGESHSCTQDNGVDQVPFSLSSSGAPQGPDSWTTGSSFPGPGPLPAGRPGEAVWVPASPFSVLSHFPLT